MSKTRARCHVDRSADVGPAVGSRVRHAIRGEGTVVEHMDDGRTRVEFADGDVHRYHEQSLYKLSPLPSSKRLPTGSALPGPSDAGTSASVSHRELDLRFEAVLASLELPPGAAENMRTFDDAKKRQLIEMHGAPPPVTSAEGSVSAGLSAPPGATKPKKKSCHVRV